MYDLGPGIVLTVACLVIGFTLYSFIKAGHTERLARIQLGQDADDPNNRSYLEIKFGLLLLGIGMGLSIAFLLERVTNLSDTDVYYPALMLVFGGAALVYSYFLIETLRKND
jgi:hypothetical protein